MRPDGLSKRVMSIPVYVDQLIRFGPKLIGEDRCRLYSLEQGSMHRCHATRSSFLIPFSAAGLE